MILIVYFANIRWLFIVDERQIRIITKYEN